MLNYNKNSARNQPLMTAGGLKVTMIYLYVIRCYNNSRIMVCRPEEIATSRAFSEPFTKVKPEKHAAYTPKKNKLQGESHEKRRFFRKDSPGNPDPAGDESTLERAGCG